MKVYMVRADILVLFTSFCRLSAGLNYSLDWLRWENVLHDSYLKPFAVFPEDVDEHVRAMCLIKYEGSYQQAFDAETCTKGYLKTFSNQRGKENGMMIQMSARSSCYEAYVSIPPERKIPVIYDLFDDSSDISEEIATFLNISAGSDMFEAIQTYMADKIKGIPEDSRRTPCPAAQSRRLAEQWAAATFSSTSAVSGQLAPSSFECKQPFSKKEWLLPEMNALIPLGTCVFRNLYLHNNVWYYLADLQSQQFMPSIRLNSRTVENRPLSYELSPVVVSEQNFRDLIARSVQRRQYSGAIQVGAS